MFISLIENRTIQYHFANCGIFDERYTNEVNKLYNIQKIYNTNKPPNNYKNFLKILSYFQMKIFMSYIITK